MRDGDAVADGVSPGRAVARRHAPVVVDDVADQHLDAVAGGRAERLEELAWDMLRAR